MTYTLHDAFTDVVQKGTHLSSVLERIFEERHPTPEEAYTTRLRLMQAVRYGNVDDAIRGKLDTTADPDRFVQNLPAFIRDRMAGQAEGLVQDAPTFIRVNTLKATNKQVLSALSAFRPYHQENQCVMLDQPFGVFRTDSFRNGWWEMQDLNSQRVSEMLQVQPGQRVVDLCAGAGGKTLHLAAMMQNRGRIVALDIKEGALETLRLRARRAGVGIAETRVITSTKTVKRMAETADAVLLDVPCTGTGVLRRNPDIVYRLNEQSLASMVEQQADILRRGAKIVRAGGRIVYATCSILPEEGIAQVEGFVKEHPEYEIAEAVEYRVGEDGGDGFFVAALSRATK